MHVYIYIYTWLCTFTYIIYIYIYTCEGRQDTCISGCFDAFIVVVVLIHHMYIMSVNTFHVRSICSCLMCYMPVVAFVLMWSCISHVSDVIVYDIICLWACVRLWGQDDQGCWHCDSWLRRLMEPLWHQVGETLNLGATVPPRRTGSTVSSVWSGRMQSHCFHACVV